MIRTACLMIVSAMVAMFLAGCSVPQKAEAVSQYTVDATNRVAQSYAKDLTLLQSTIEGHIQAARVIRTGDIHRELIVHGYVTSSGQADINQFHTDIKNPQVDTALVREVRAGRMAQNQADTWLADYAAMGSLSQSRPQRDAQVAQLADIQQFDEAAEAVRQALDAHAKDVGGLLNEVVAGAQSIGSAAARQSSVDWRAVANQSVPAVSDLLITAIPNANKRQAVSDLLGAILNPPTH